MTELPHRQPILWRIGLLVLLLIGVALRLYNALRPLEELLLSTIPDDAFYYFVWARSLAAGQGPVVSDGTWTSGVHVLWGLLLTAC